MVAEGVPAAPSTIIPPLAPRVQAYQVALLLLPLAAP